MSVARNPRVVVTGAGGITPLGNDRASIEASLRACRNAVRKMPEWGIYEGLNTRLAAPAAVQQALRT